MFAKFSFCLLSKRPFLRFGGRIFMRSFKYSTARLREFISDFESNREGARTRNQNSFWQTGSTIEVWSESQPGAPLVRFAAYPVCKYSGTLGPKKRKGDLQSMEGYYTIHSSCAVQPEIIVSTGFQHGIPEYVRESKELHGKCHYGSRHLWQRRLLCHGRLH